MNKKTDISVQSWIPIENIFEDGIIQTKENKFIKIIKILPINYDLKSMLEKESILNSYKIFFNTCEFNTQILIQSKKENLKNHFKNIENRIKKDDEKIKIISQNYFEYISNLNKKNKSSSKNFYIIINYKYLKDDISNNFPNDNEKQIIISNLKERYLKIKECLSRTNNICIELEKEEIIDVLYSFFNKRKEQK